MANEIIIHDGNWWQFINPTVDGDVKKCGTIPRDWTRFPHGSLMHARAFDVPLVPQSDWTKRIADQVAAKSRNSDVRATGNAGQLIPSRDQNGVGYCWCHSGVSAHLINRAKMGEPYVDLSPFAIGCMVKNFRDEGGWGSEGIEFQAQKGCPTSQFWPQRSMSRSNDNAATWANAALHKYTAWADLDPNQMQAQIVTCALLNLPMIGDFNWWSHSVCVVDIVDGASEWLKTRSEESGKLMSLREFDRVWDMDGPMNGLGTRIWNSWGDTWSDKGMGLLTGSKAWPDSAWAATLMTPSVN